jgi:hypothetical protein
MYKKVVASMLVLGGLIGLPSVTEAAPKAGCPAAISGWRELTVHETVEIVYAGLLDKENVDKDDLAARLAGADRKGDGLCLLTLWGDDVNENSHWYRVGMQVLGEGTKLFLVIDNNANPRR